MKAIILARVSSKDQEDNYSIPAQIDKLEGYCRKKGFTLIKSFSLVESSTRGDRPEFMKMIDFIKKSKEPVALVVDAVDRLQRRLSDIEILNELRVSGKVEIHLLRENKILSKDSTSSSLFEYYIFVLFAQRSTDTLSENVKRSFQQKFVVGTIHGLCPLGYLNHTHPSGETTVILDRERAHIIKKIFEEYSTGIYSQSEMANKANEYGLRTRRGSKIYKSGINTMLKNKFYYGIMTYNKKETEHIYEKLISKQLYDKCQNVISGKTTQKGRASNYGQVPSIFRGLITCDNCGCQISMDRVIKPNGKEYHYLFCTKARGNCDAKRLNEEKASKQIQELFDSFELPENTVTEMKGYLRKISHAKQEDLKFEIETDQRRYRNTFERQNNLYDMKLEGNGMSQSYFDNKLIEIKNERENLKNKLSALEDTDDKFYITMDLLLELSQNAGSLFKSSNVFQKRRLMKIVLSNLKLKDGSLCFSLKKPFNVFAKIGESPKWLGW